MSKGVVGGKEGWAMLIEVRMPGVPGFNIIVATAAALAGPWSIRPAVTAPATAAATAPPAPAAVVPKGKIHRVDPKFAS